MAETKAGSIYYYFDSKEAILDEVLDEGLYRIFEAVKTALKKAGNVSHRRRIGLAIESHLAALLEASDFTSANIRIYGQLPERLKKRHRPLRRAYAKYWDRLFLDARRAGEIRADIEIVPLRVFVLGALNWTVEWFSFSNKETVRKLARRTELLIFDGVTKNAQVFIHRNTTARCIDSQPNYLSPPLPLIRLATSSSITSVLPPPIDCTRASRDIRSIVLSRM